MRGTQHKSKMIVRRTARCLNILLLWFVRERRDPSELWNAAGRQLFRPVPSALLSKREDIKRNSRVAEGFLPSDSDVIS